ncbi:MAG: hypothetical protein R3E82_08035 [Pseudomonadales bacterium]|nr:hypothetical protein [Pseudomonadales bacterium]
MSQPLSDRRLHSENLAYAGTGGVSQNNGRAGFVPAFRDDATGRVEVARMENGEPATMHLLCALPDEWVCARDADGRVTALLASVVAGFVREGRFYTREEAAALV